MAECGISTREKTIVGPPSNQDVDAAPTRRYRRPQPIMGDYEGLHAWGESTPSSSASAAPGPLERVRDVDVPLGKVEKVCREWLVREDGVLAERLQSEEINQHYQGNRFKNKIVRTDLHQAKSLQQCEEDEALAKQLSYEEQQKRLAEMDEALARELQETLMMEERQRNEEMNRRIEEEDERLARKFHEKEKKKIIKRRLEKELKEVEKVRAEKISELLQDDDEVTDRILSEINSDGLRDATQRYMTRRAALLERLDLSELSLPPPPGLTAEQLRHYREEQDEHLARLLYEEEARSTATAREAIREKMALIEAQDFEIAKVLQEQENEKARKIKEKLRRRRQQQRQERLREAQEAESMGAHFIPPLPPPPPPPIPEHQNHEFHSSPEPYYDRVAESPITASESPHSRPDSGIPFHPHNIAIDLDPTYKRSSRAFEGAQKRSLERPKRAEMSLPRASAAQASSPPVSDDPCTGTFEAVPYRPSSSSESSPTSTWSHTQQQHHVINPNSTRSKHVESAEPSLPGPPSYIPMHGQRRNASNNGTIEKSKSYKKHLAKDNCKTH